METHKQTSYLKTCIHVQFWEICY